MVKGTVIAVVVLVLLGGALRLAAARNDLWFDEIWTLLLLDRITAPGDILTRLRHDNNHPLNSLLAWWLRGESPPWVIRLPAVLAGMLTVLAASGVGWRPDGPDGERRRSAAGALVAGTLAAVSFPLVHFGSEARGYALAVAGVFGAILAANRGTFRPATPWALVYGASLSLAFAAHATALHAFVGCIAWSLACLARRREPLWRRTAAFVWWQALPLVAAVSLLTGFLRHVRIGGGPRLGVATVAGRAAAYVVGLPSELPWPVPLGIVVVVLCGGAWWLARRRAPSWSLYVGAVALGPVLAYAANPTDLQFERYYLVAGSVWLLLVARLLADAWERGHRCRLAAGVALAVFVAGNGARILRLLDEGRGQYAAAIARMVEGSAPGPITIGGDHDSRTITVLRHHADRMGVLERLSYVSLADVGSVQPEWFLAHRFEHEDAPPAEVRPGGGPRYRLDRVFPSGPLAGWRWFLYRRDQ